MKQKMKQWLGTLLSIALILGLMPGMSLTALADAPEGIEVLNEDFSVGIPSTWSISQGTYRFEAKDGYVWADPSKGLYEGDAFCYSPAVDLSKAATAKLIFKYKKPHYSDLDGSDDLYVYYITNGTYNELWNDISFDGKEEWTQVTIELPSGAFKEGVQIAFKAINWKDLGAFFDDVSIYYKKSITATAENTVVPYDGEAHGITVSVIEPSSGATVMYGTAEGVYNQTSSPTITNVADSPLTVYYKITADNYADKTGLATVTINKGNPTIIAPTAKTLTYNGQAQALVNAGSTKDGTLYYALTTESKAPTDESLYTTSIPTGTNAGTYYVWYKAVGDGEHSDSESACITVTIEDNKNTGNSGTIEPVVDQKGNTPKAEVEGLDEELATNVMTDDEKNKVKIDASTGFYSGLKISQKNGKIKVSWDKGEDASKYAVYAAYCGNKFASKPVKTTKSTSATFKKINGKKIDFSKNLKIYVTAYDASGKKIGNTVSAHFAGKNNKKYKNPKAVKLTTTALTIEVGKSAKVKASVKMESGKKIALNDAHCAKLRYKTTNKKIATVDKNGNVTGVAAGTCEVYVYSKNGLAKKCTITVK